MLGQAGAHVSCPRLQGGWSLPGWDKGKETCQRGTSRRGRGRDGGGGRGLQERSGRVCRDSRGKAAAPAPTPTSNPGLGMELQQLPAPSLLWCLMLNCNVRGFPQPC